MSSSPTTTKLTTTTNTCMRVRLRCCFLILHCLVLPHSVWSLLIPIRIASYSRHHSVFSSPVHDQVISASVSGRNYPCPVVISHPAIAATSIINGSASQLSMFMMTRNRKPHEPNLIASVGTIRPWPIIEKISKHEEFIPTKRHTGGTSRIRSWHRLSMSTAEEPLASSEEKYRSRIYLLTFLSYFIVASRMLFLAPVNPGKMGSVSEWMTFSAIQHGGATGFFLASCLSYLMHKNYKVGKMTGREEMQHNKLGGGDDLALQSIERRTRSQINFGLAIFSCIGLLSVPGESALFPSFPSAFGYYSFVSVSRLLAAGFCGREWFRQSCGDVSGSLARITSDDDGLFSKLSFMVVACGRAVRDTWKINVEDSKSNRNKPRNIYTLVQWFVLSRMVHNIMSFQHVSKTCSDALFWKSIYISAVARLSLVLCIASTLKEASFRSYHPVKIIRWLNILLGAWALSAGILSGFLDAKLVSFILQKSVYLMMFAWPIMFKGNQDSDGMDRQDENDTKGTTD